METKQNILTETQVKLPWTVYPNQSQTPKQIEKKEQIKQKTNNVVENKQFSTNFWF